MTGSAFGIAQRSPRSARRRFAVVSSRAILPVLAAAVASVPLTTLAEDISPPAILQYFETPYSGVENRMADLFAAGYGSLYTPPPGRASSGTSVGYDQYDRFDLGKAGDPTLYGTETGLRTAV